MIDLKEFSIDPSHKSWENAVKKTLKGSSNSLPLFDLDKNISVNAYTKAIDVKTTHSITTSTLSCKVAQLYQVKRTEIDQINKTILQALNYGTNSIRLEFDQAPSSMMFAELLKDVFPEMISIHIIVPSHHELEETIQQYAAFLSTNVFSSIACQGSITCKTYDLPKTLHILMQIEAFKRFPNMRFFEITSDHKTISETISSILHQAHNIIFSALSHNIDIQTIESKIQVILLVDSSFLIEVAKLKSIRILWQRILNAYTQTESNPLYLITYSKHPGYQNSKDEDIYANILHQTAEALGALIGTSDEHVISSFDSKTSKNEFAERISRNVVHLLHDESQIENRKDPLKGAYVIEILIEKIIYESWQHFLLGEHNK